MGDLLFNPNGRIQKNRFWQGLVVLTVASVILQAVQVKLGPSFGFVGTFIFFALGLALLYADICVYAKRFHDAGTTGWWILAVWLGSYIVSIILSSMFGSMFIGEQGIAIQEEMMERMAQGELMIALEAAEALGELLLPLTIASMIANAVIMGFIVGSLKTDPRQNKHGPVPGEEWRDF